MPRYRRTLAGAFVAITSLFYIYWILRPEQIRVYRPPDDALNSTLGFAHILVLNLPSRPDRRAALSAAAAATNLSLTWRDAQTGSQVPASSLPGLRSPGARGSWASHMDAVTTVAGSGMGGSALIMEDDVDWDVRLRGQVSSFAGAARAWLDTPTTAGGKSESIYGEGWDVLWLGHCGTDLPSSRIIARADPSVPAPRHLKPHPFARGDALGSAYAAHARVVHEARGTVCSLAYAVSARGARRLARDFSPPLPRNKNNARKGFYQWDLMLRDWCEGGFSSEPGEEEGGEEQEERGPKPVCLTVQPPLISHYFGAGGSNIRGLGGGYARGVTGSPYIRLSVRANLERLMAGVPEEGLVDQLPDDGEALW
ncbi:glycosyltransferase family 25 protein [Camillea tinctor]|nr:glycosyltransferase family 25 protein [Camillea tinctor]